MLQSSRNDASRPYRHCEEIKKHSSLSITLLSTKQSKFAKQPYSMGGYVYIMSSLNKSTLYIGVTSNLPVRVLQHKQREYQGFTSKYNCIKLVYYCRLDTIEEAITEEKRIKGGSRKKKEALINSMNPDWKDLYEEII